MNILLIDGQGGKMGKRLAEEITARFPDQTLTVVGTNSVATSTMLKGGAAQGATGENAVVVCSRRADMIVGPIGIVIADSMLGEITPQMALAVAQSDAVKILIPANRCNHLVAGVKNQTLSDLISDATDKIASLLESK